MILLALFSGSVSGQELSTKLTRIQTSDGIETYACKAIYFDISPPLIEMAKGTVSGKKRREDRFESLPNPHKNKQNVPFAPIQDPVVQNYNGPYLPTTSGPIQNFEGTGNLDGYLPPDTQGDVGLDRYFQVVNCRYSIWDKLGNVILSGVQLGTLWAGIPSPWSSSLNDGDPVVLYDQAANRWMITQFSLPNSTNHAELVAISTTSDPAGTWYRYVFTFGSSMPDYPKLGIWPDGYYMSVNKFNSSGTAYLGVSACVLERAKMLVGDNTAQMVQKDLGASGDPWAMLPSDWDGTNTPPAAEPNYFMYYNDWTTPATPTLNIWAFHTDWTNITNCTISQAASLPAAYFNSVICSSGTCIPQPGTTQKLDDLADRLMYRNQYRVFSGYQSMVTSQSILSGSSSGCRWYELRNSGSGWSIYQQGTYAPDANYRWMPSVAMNSQGDIALGYSISAASTIYPSIRYTGRRAADPLGTMTVLEQSIIAGGGSQTSSAARWGDYSMMSVDPTDDQTFWFTTEYMQSTSSAGWHTRIASFKFSNNPVIATTDATAVTPISATLNGTINPNGLAATYHFEWGTTTSYGNNTTTASAGSGTSAVAVNAPVTGLTGGTTYHFRLTGVNSDGSTNGNDMTFTPGAAVVTTTAATSITMTSASSGGNVTADGGASITARGLCWSTTANPTITGSHTTDGSGLGVFTSSLTGLTANTQYHIRAYATNSYGTWYGSDLTFNTLCALYTLPFTESFATTTIPSCWSQVDHQGNSQIWQFGVITSSGAPVLTGNYAFLNSRAYASGNSQNADLLTPVLDCSAFGTVTLAFNHYFRQGGSSSGTLSYSNDGGTTWNPIQTWTTSSTNPAVFSSTVPGAAGSATVKFRWNYTGTYNYWWAIDDISVTGVSPSTLSVLPSNQSVPDSPAGTTNFTVTSNTSWTVVSDQSWCTVLPAGTGNGTIVASYAVNPDPFTRIANVTVTVSGLPAITVTVTQAAAPLALSVQPPNQTVPSSPASYTTFSVISNSNWSVVSDQAWCIVNPSGSGNGIITATYTDNTSTTNRIANITVTVTGLTPVVVTVTQVGTSPTLTVTPSNKNVPYLSGNTAFTVLSNSSWTATSDSAWLSVTPAGSGNGTIDAAFLQNPYYAQRVATITVVVAGIPAQMVTVTQAQSTVSVREHTAGLIRIIPNPSKGGFCIDAGEMKYSSLNVTIMDLTGRTILQRVCTAKTDLLFDLSASPEGSYIIKITSDNLEQTQKLILTH